LGPIPDDASLEHLGEALVTALKAQDDARVVTRGAAGIASAGAGPAAAWGVTPVGVEVTGRQLAEQLTYPPEWGPTEWGPIPFLPDNDILVEKMEKQWGNLATYRGISSTASGSLLVSGLQLGNVFIGVQPLLGLEGDPMRLLFERDLTPHPQYAAFYKWLQEV
jgi:magnesium chelatase subunit H